MNCPVTRYTLKVKNQLIPGTDGFILTSKSGGGNHFNLFLIKINNVATFMIRICLYTD